MRRWLVIGILVGWGAGALANWQATVDLFNKASQEHAGYLLKGKLVKR